MPGSTAAVSRAASRQTRSVAKRLDLPAEVHNHRRRKVATSNQIRDRLRPLIWGSDLTLGIEARVDLDVTN
jgi:predicted component of type VI protein secretion system